MAIRCSWPISRCQPPLETPIEDVRSFALTRLPDHMVPTTFVVVETMPVGDLGQGGFDRGCPIRRVSGHR